MNNLFSTTDLQKLTVLKEQVQKKQFSKQLLISANDEDKIKNFAIILAKFLLCKKNMDLECNCENCQRVDNSSYYDLKIYGDFATTIKKEEIQNIIQTFNYSALEQYGIKIYILNGAEFLTPEAANALLKFLEEPTANTYAILLTKNRNKVLETIRSRCLNIILNNSLNKISENISKEFIEKFVKNIFSLSKQNFILVRELFGNPVNEINDIFMKLANLFKYQNWDSYDIDVALVTENFKKKLPILFEICYTTTNLLQENLNKELILEKAVIEIYNEVK